MFRYLKLNDVLDWESEWCYDPAVLVRGFVSFTIDPFSCSLLKVTESHIQQVASLLDSVPDGKVLLGLSNDESIYTLIPGADMQDKRSYKDAFAFIVQKGFPEKAAFREVATDKAEFKAVITGI